jgi:bifunctional UDP-N-acetylglucosamine pyrophosphorylase/glucosamine-1-phosphate N-acetyltransferase
MADFDFSRVKGVILAAGRGVRIKSDLPKVVHPILGTPIVRYVAKSMKEAGLGELIAVVGYKKEMVIKTLGDEATFVDQGEPRGTGHALLACRRALSGYSGPLVVLNGDMPLISPETIRTLAAGLDKLSVDAMIVTACLDDPSGYGRVIRDEQGRVLRIVEESDAGMERTINEVNAGAYSFRAPQIFDTLARIRPENAKNEYYLTDAVALLLKARKKIQAVRVNNVAEAMGVNSRKDQVAVQNYLRWKIVERHMENGVAILDPSTVYIEDDVAIGRDSTIEPFTVIHRGVRIGNGCHVGPFSHLRAGSVLSDGAEIGNFVEIKNSRIGPRSRAKHLSYLGDATLGGDVNIGAGTITANYDGRAKHATRIEEGASTGSNTVIVAPARLGRHSRTGAGAVILAGSELPEGATAVGVPARILKTRKIGRKAK